MAIDELSLMPKWKQLAFVARIAGRLTPNFEAFSVETGWGDPKQLNLTLDRIWAQLESSDEMVGAQGLLLSCEKQMPDTEDFSSVLTSTALDAVGVICLCLEGFKGAAVQYLDAAQLATDSIDLYLQYALNPESGNTEVAVAHHPLMRQELADQDATIGILKGHDDRDEVVRRLKNLSAIRGSFREAL
jgi:uncharacterized protein YjaG (DUF416 family)